MDEFLKLVIWSEDVEIGGGGLIAVSLSPDIGLMIISQSSIMRFSHRQNQQTIPLTVRLSSRSIWGRWCCAASLLALAKSSAFVSPLRR
jgi:hypothetical protein